MAEEMDISRVTAADATSEEVVLSATGIAVKARLCAASSESILAIRAQLDDRWPNLMLTRRTSGIRAEDVVLSELLNQRGPAAWVVACEPSNAVTDAHVHTLSRLALDCRTTGSVLVLTTQSSFDLILVPREACREDGVAFAAFATRVDGVAFISRTIAAKQVAVVLDLDSTLLESEHLPVQPPDWRDLHWRSLRLTQQPSGQAVTGRVCQLPGEPHHAESVHAASWLWKGAAHNYRVRQRLGWSHLRDLLIQETRPAGKLSAYVLSLGRPLYIQTAWQILDPAGQIIPHHEFGRKLNSARPDGVSHVPEKTPCIGTGLRSVFGKDFNMRLGPVWCADDIPEVYNEKYRDGVYPVEAYRPVAGLPNQYDDGSVLREMSGLLLHFWEHCYGADGQGGVVAQLAAAASQTLRHLSAVPLVSRSEPSDWCAGLFKGQEKLSSALSVRAFMELRSAEQLVCLSPASTDELESAASENDENLLQAKVLGSTPKAQQAVPAERALRPSSRQDNMGPIPVCCQPTQPKPGAQQAQQVSALLQSTAAAVAVQQPVAVPAEGWRQADITAASTEDDLTTIKIAPCDDDSGDSKLMLVVGESQRGQHQAVHREQIMADGKQAVNGSCSVVVAAAIVCLTGSPAEDAEVVATLLQEESSESCQPGRKRDFASIISQDTLLVPETSGVPAANL